MGKISIDLKTGKIQDEKSKSNEHEEGGELIVGIDLGTSNSLVAYVEDGNAKIVRADGEKSVLVPSVIHFAENDAILVGDAAKKKLADSPENTIYSIKRFMGKSYKDLDMDNDISGYHIIEEDDDSLVKIKVRDKYYTPIELSANILAELKSRVEKELEREVQKAVITVPAYFNDTQRQATRFGGKIAGLDVLRIINEPTAASLAYGLQYHENEGETIAVYDLGGGTFDISILKIEQGVFEVLSTNGDTALGGDDIDKAIVAFWIEKFNFPEESAVELRLKAEEVKKKLGEKEHSQFEFRGEKYQMQREELFQLAEPIIDKTLKSCEKAMKDAKLTAADLDHVLLVGGSTRMPYLRKQVAEFFGRELNTSLNPDRVVAIGAAIQADILAGNNKDFLLLDITPLSLGIETMGGLMDVILPRNSKIPTRVGREYTTSLDGQKNLKISIFQGERELVKDNRKLGKFILSGIPPMPAGIPKIEIGFIINADGILQVHAEEKRSGVKQEIEVRPQYGISEEEMALMLVESLEHAEEDMKQRALLEAKTEAEQVLSSTEKFIAQNKSDLKQEQIDRFAVLCNRVAEAIEKKDKNAIQGALDKLNTYAGPLAQKVMDAVIKTSMKGKNIHEE